MVAFHNKKRKLFHGYIKLSIFLSKKGNLCVELASKILLLFNDQCITSDTLCGAQFITTIFLPYILIQEAVEHEAKCKTIPCKDCEVKKRQD